MGHVGMVMVPNLGTCVKTIPLTMVSWVLMVLQLIWWVHRLHFNFRVLLGVAGYETSTRNIIIIFYIIFMKWLWCCGNFGMLSQKYHYYFLILAIQLLTYREYYFPVHKQSKV